MCAVSVISACSSLKRVYRIATVATITEKNAIIFLVFRYLVSKSTCITMHTHTHTHHPHTHKHTHTHTHTAAHGLWLQHGPHGQGEPTRSRWIGPMLWVRISVSAIS